MRIAFYGGLDDEKKKYYQDTLGKDHDIDVFDFCLGEEGNETFEYEVISIFVACKASKEILEKFPKLKMIAVRSTGFDNVDLEYCKEKGITVSTVPAYGTHTVAEYAFALLLQISRKTNEATANPLKGDFEHGTLRGFDLNEKTIGVIGTGKIGANTLRIAKGFNMKILAFDMYQNHSLQEEVGFEYVDLDALLEKSDIISLHAPSTPETHHMINAEAISKMKKGVVLINTGRGALTDTKALLEGVTSGQISALGIDVLEEEKQLQGVEDENENTKYAKELITLPNVHYSAHVAFYTKEAEHNIMETTVQNIEKFLIHEPQNNVAK